MTLVDHVARRRIAEDLDATLVVEAAAGTGKTTALCRRMLALVTSGRARLAELVAVTFTEKAAGELKLRLRGDIEDARRDADGEIRARLDRALAELEAAHIGTIHGFCADLLRERPIEAGVDPLFEVAAEDAQQRLFDAAFEEWFAASLAAPGEGVRRVLRRDDAPRKTLRKAGWDLSAERDFSAPWRRDPLDREAEIDAVLEALGRLAELAPDDATPTDWLDKLLVEIRRDLAEGRREPRDLDRTEVMLRKLSRKKPWSFRGSKRDYRGVPKATVLALRDEAKQALDRTLARCEADLAALLAEDLRGLSALYEEHKARAGALDFLDLLGKTRALLGNEPVRRELALRFSHLLVDEFQDTDPLQAEILLLLADAGDVDGTEPLRPLPGKLFVVGDPKQSIYRFRRADVALYERIKRRLVRGGAEVLHLSASFRALPEVQAIVNAAFAPEMRGDDAGLQAAYVPLAPVRVDRAPQPAVVALPVPSPFGAWGKVTARAIDASLPDAVGAFVDWLLRESGWTVSEAGAAARVPVAARHVCLLFKRMTWYGGDVTQPYVRALEARRVPHVLLGGRSYHAREEVQALSAALTAIEWPDDELAVYAALRGAFFALSDEALLGWRASVGSFHTIRPVARETLSPSSAEVAEALTVLGDLHRRRNRRPVADTIAELLDRTRAHAGVAIWPAGEQALSNLMRMMDLARRFETGAPTSFRAFLERLRVEAERGGSAEAPVVEEGTDGVRIMSVHKAKGLEFPVVVLCDPTAPPAFERPTRWSDPARGLSTLTLAGCAPVELAERAEEVLARDRAESVRLAYVAATRARDLLVVPAVSDAPLADSWLAPLWRAIYPTRAGWRFPMPAPGCPAFGWDSAASRPPEVDDPERGVAPGGHIGEACRGQADPPVVVWWDANVLALGRTHAAGLRKESLLAASEEGDGSEPGARAYEAWARARGRVLAEASVPLFTVTTATALAAASTGAEAIEIATTAAFRGDVLAHPRPGGARFGTLVHAVLAEVPAGAAPEVVARTAAALGRVLLAPEHEIVAAAEAARAALDHPLLVRAFAAGPRREVPIVLPRADGSIVEGVIDLAFREETAAGGSWVVVDFKTDAGAIDPAGRYAAQLALYVEAITAATGEPARGVLLRV